MSPYPLIYCPLVDGKDIPKPACCARALPFRAKPGCGPDGSGGIIYGDPLPDPVVAPWIKTPAGWWVYHDGQKPQNLQRIDRHPRIQRWVWVDGADEGHRWLVPQLFVRDSNDDLVMTIDRQMTATGWQVGDDLSPLIESLMSIEAGVPLHVDPEVRAARVIEVAIELLTLGSWVDRDLLIALGWFTEAVAVRVIRVALGMSPELPGTELVEGLGAP